MMPFPPSQRSAASPLEGQDAAALLKNPAALKSLLQSPETLRLMELLQRQGNLQSAAQKAKAGDTQDLQAMLSKLQSSPEGGAALSQIEEKLHR